MSPSKEQAEQFALMLHAGLPAGDAILYFMPEGSDLGACIDAARRWEKHRLVLAALDALNGGEWVGKSPQERIELSLEKVYNEMAYFLFSHNYGDLQGDKQRKADTCRLALEAKLAGMAGKMDALYQFWSDMKAGRQKSLAAAFPKES